jgi:hypothetical protein
MFTAPAGKRSYILTRTGTGLKNPFTLFEVAILFVLCPSPLYPVNLTCQKVHRCSSHVSLSMPAGVLHRLCVRPSDLNADSRPILKGHPISFVLTLFRSFEPPRASQGISIPNPQHRAATHSSIHFAAAMQSNMTGTMSSTSAFTQTERMSGLAKSNGEYETYLSAG